MKIKSSRNGQIILSFTGKSCHNREFYVANMSFNAIREDKILAKISEFTVYDPLILMGAPRGFGDLGRTAIYFQGAGQHW